MNADDIEITPVPRRRAPRKPPEATDEASSVPTGEPPSVWTFRGYQLKASDFNTAMVHFFRGEISRANVWRQRLDATTNWAVITTGAAISFAFNSESGNEQAVLLLNTLLVTLFLYIEARRYRYYELFSYRVRLMETDFYAAMLVPPFSPAHDWAESLAENLLSPSFPISMLEAWGRRYRRNYLFIYVLLGIAWLMKIWMHPSPPASTFTELVHRASIGTIPGWAVLTFGLAFNGVLLAVGVLTVGLTRATGEVLPVYGTQQGRDILESVVGDQSIPRRIQARFRQSRRRAQVLAFVVTGKAEAVSRKIIEEMKRGVTAMPAKGMYTGQDREVLLCALTVTEVKQFEALVREADEQAFLIVSPAQEVMGAGFLPLSEAEREHAGRIKDPHRPS